MTSSALTPRPRPAVGPLFRILLSVQRFVPLFIKVPFVTHVLGPRRTATLAVHTPGPLMLPVTQRLAPDFNADVTLYLAPQEIRDLLDHMPNDVWIAIARALMDKGKYEITAGFADLLTENEIRAFIVTLNDPEGVMNIAPHLADPERVVNIARRFSNTYLVKLGKAACAGGNHAIAARVCLGVSPDRQRVILDALSAADRDKVLAQYSAGERRNVNGDQSMRRA
ncbi:MAG: hypothetical protein LAT61_07600 [Alcanivorax sp.]|nr:hypothetical protein [Alcanivorax sp.]